MRGVALAVLLALPGCNPGITPPQNAQRERPPANAPAPKSAVNEVASPPTANIATKAPEATTPPGLAGMSPYRRREYERGYRDCMSGNFDGERQGESYRIGCMAAEDAKQRR